MSPRSAAAVIAVVLLAIGFVLAVRPLSVGLLSDEVACGSAFQPSYATADIKDIYVRAGLDDRRSSGSYVEQCEEKVSDRRMVAFPLAGVGALALLFLLLTGQQKTRWDAEDAPAGEAEQPSV